MEKIMSKSSRASPTPDIVRELRDDELEKVSGGKSGAIVVADFNWSVRRSDGGRS
jgi:hypothetical protein